jgi:hypothetical protein
MKGDCDREAGRPAEGKKEPHEPCERPRVPNLMRGGILFFVRTTLQAYGSPESSGLLAGSKRKGAVYERTWAWA